MIFLNLKKALKNKNIKQSELARKLNISRQSLRYKLNSWEEKRKGFNIDELLKISMILGEDLNFFK